jgi:hypothetical protein
MSKWPFKTIDETLYKMHEAYKTHPPRVEMGTDNPCTCGLWLPCHDILVANPQQSIVENLAIGNPWYLAKPSKYLANMLMLMKYPFPMPIHQSLAAYTIALNYLNDIPKCDAKSIAIALYVGEQNDIVRSLLIQWDIYTSDYKEKILSTWEIEGNLIQEILNL